MTLTKSDKKWVEGVLWDALDNQEVKFERKIDEVKNDFYDKIDDIKNDFYNKIDPILKEVTTNEEERTILSHRVSTHSDRIENIENKLNIEPAF